jgi:hypothetical protein
MNIKDEIDKLSDIKNIDDKIKKINIIKSEIEKNKNQLKKLMEDIDNNATHINNDNNINLEELKTKFYNSNNINEKINYYKLFANKINLLENELFEN